MATIDDVAREAGVSHGTVSKVLNGSPNVSIDKINRVEAAILKLNYKPNAFARYLKVQRSRHIEVILPSIEDFSLSNLYDTLCGAASTQGYSVTLRISREVPQRECDILNEAILYKPDSIIVMTCQPHNGKFFESLIKSGHNIVFLLRDIPGHNFNFVTLAPKQVLIDDIKARIAEGNQRIAIVAGPKEYSYEAECVDGYLNAMLTNDFPLQNNYMEITNYSSHSAMRSAVRLLNLPDPPQIIYATSDLLAKGVQQAMRYLLPDKSDHPPVLLRLISDAWACMASPSDVHLPYTKMGNAALDIALDSANAKTPLEYRRLTIWNSEQNGRQIPAIKHRQSSSLSIMTTETPSGNSITLLQADFYHRTGLTLQMQSFEDNVLYKLRDVLHTGKPDLFTIDVPWLPELVRTKNILDLREHSKELSQISELFPDNILSKYCCQDGDLYALPFSFTTQLLFYRTDLFGALKNQRLYSDMFQSELRPPTTWDEYNQVAKFFTREYNSESPTPYGTAVFAKEGIEIMSRLWAYGGKVLEDGEIIVNKPACIKALKNYCETINYIPNKQADESWTRDVQRFLDGDIAMICMYSDYMSSIEDRRFSRVVGKVGFSLLPGKTGMFGGWSLGINPYSKNIPHAIEFLKWATSQRMAMPAAVLGRFIPFSSSFQDTEIFSMYPWSKVALEALSHAKRRPEFVDPKTKLSIADKIYPELSECLAQARQGAITAEEALEKAERWIRNAIE